MARESCLEHRKRERLILIRESFIQLMGGDHCAAALLAFFEYLTNGELERMEKAEEDGDPWVRVSLNKVAADMMGHYSRRRLQERLQWFVVRGLIQTREPGPGRIRDYLLSVDEINSLLSRKVNLGQMSEDDLGQMSEVPSDDDNFDLSEVPPPLRVKVPESIEYKNNTPISPSQESQNQNPLVPENSSELEAPLPPAPSPAAGAELHHELVVENENRLDVETELPQYLQWMFGRIGIKWRPTLAKNQPDLERLLDAEAEMGRHSFRAGLLAMESDRTIDWRKIDYPAKYALAYARTWSPSGTRIPRSSGPLVPQETVHHDPIPGYSRHPNSPNEQQYQTDPRLDVSRNIEDRRLLGFDSLSEPQSLVDDPDKEPPNRTDTTDLARGIREIHAPSDSLRRQVPQSPRSLLSESKDPDGLCLKPGNCNEKSGSASNSKSCPSERRLPRTGGDSLDNSSSSGPYPHNSTPMREAEPSQGAGSYDLGPFQGTWNSIVPEPLRITRWTRYEADLTAALADDEFREGFQKICETCRDLVERPTGKVTGVGFAWLFRAAKGKPVWWQLLTGFYAYGIKPKESTDSGTNREESEDSKRIAELFMRSTLSAPHRR